MAQATKQQRLFLDSKGDDVLWRAGRGAGKTFGLLLDWWENAPEETLSIFIPKDMELLPFIERDLKVIAPLGRWGIQQNRFSANGKTLRFFNIHDSALCVGFAAYRLYLDEINLEDETLDKDLTRWHGIVRGQSGSPGIRRTETDTQVPVIISIRHLR